MGSLERREEDLFKLEFVKFESYSAKSMIITTGD